MDKDEELRLRLRLAYLEQQHSFLMECVSRLLKLVSMKEEARAKQYSAKEFWKIKVPVRSLATIFGLLRKFEGNPEGSLK